MTALALVAVAPTPDAFAQAVGSAAQGGGSALAVLPEDDFARAIIDRSPGLRAAAPDQADILCLTHRDRAALEQALHGELDRRSGTVIIPRVAGHGLDRALFLISIPRAGTHLLYRFAEMLGFQAGVVCPEIPAPGYWYCVEYSNSHTVPRDFFVDSVRRAVFGNRLHPFPQIPALFIVRHPWDVLVSEASYYSRPGKTIFAGFYEGLDFPARVRRLLDDERTIGRFCERVLAFEPWLSFPNVIPLAFEDLVGERGRGDAARQERLIWSIQIKLGVPGASREIGARLFDPASPTFHKGQIGSHRAALEAALQEELAAGSGRVPRAFGYGLGDDPYSAYAEVWRRRPLHCRDSGLDATPVAQETNFWGHNLVRYFGRFYAVPLSLGPLDLAQAQDQLAGFPSADDLASLRHMVMARLLTGELQKRLQSLEETIAERTNRIASLEAAMTERHDRLRAIEQLEKRLQSLEDTIAERTNRIASLEATMTERHNRLRAIEQTLEERLKQVSRAKPS
jgi:uncharacterized coiled-coil protein SlyX